MGKKHLVYTLLDGTPAPSVTTILQLLNKPQLNDWRARMGIKKAESIRDTAGAFGSAVHAGCEAVCSEGQIPSYSSEKISMAVENFRLWAKANVRRWIAFEKAVYHDDLRYAGTIDAVAELLDGRIVLIDLKTSKKVNWEYYLQTIAYSHGQRYEDDCIEPGSLDGILIIHLNHETMTWESLIVADPQDELWTIFCYLCHIYPHWKKANG